jgi:SARP family transcriptional regulator, regulator of embCAB operon
MADNGVEFGVLGPLQICVDGAPVALGTPKQRAVLAMLMINRNRAVATEALISIGIDSRAALVSAPPGYRLTVPENSCDIGRFALGKNAGVQAAASGKFEQASRQLAAALTGDKVLAHTAFAEAEIACGRGYAVIGELESLTAEHPHREPLWAQLITAYYLAERQSDALNAYRRLRATLADDLGIDPGPTLPASCSRTCGRPTGSTSGENGSDPVSRSPTETASASATTSSSSRCRTPRRRARHCGVTRGQRA